MRTNCRFSNQLLRSIADSGIIMQRSGLFSHTRARHHSSILRILSSSILCICADRKVFLEIVNFFIRMTCLVEAIKPYVILPARVLSPLPAPVRHQWFVTIYGVTTWRWECKVQRDRGHQQRHNSPRVNITHTGTFGALSLRARKFRSHGDCIMWEFGYCASHSELRSLRFDSCDSWNGWGN